MNWQRWSAGVMMGVAMLAMAGNAAAPLADHVHVANVAVNANLPARGIVPANNDASDGMPSSTVTGSGSLPCSALLNSYWGCDGATGSGLRQDGGFIDYALGDLFGNQGAPGSPYVRNANGSPASQPSMGDQTWIQGAPDSRYGRNGNGYPVSQPSTGDQNAGGTPSAGGRAGSTQWPTAAATDPVQSTAVYFNFGPNGGQDQHGVGDLGIDVGSLPADNGPATIDETPCPPSCNGDPVATTGSPSAVAEPATLSLLGLGMLGFAGLRRRAQRARPAHG